MPPSLSTVVFCWLEAHRRASFPEELDQAVSESRSPDSGPTTPTPEPPIAFGRFPRYTGKLPRLTGTTALFYRFPRYTGKLPRMAGTSAACIRERFVLREKFTVAGTATVYKVSRCSELGQFDCSPNPEDLHGPLSGVLPLLSAAQRLQCLVRSRRIWSFPRTAVEFQFSSRAGPIVSRWAACKPSLEVLTATLGSEVHGGFPRAFRREQLVGPTRPLLRKRPRQESIRENAVWTFPKLQGPYPANLPERSGVRPEPA